MLEHGEYLVDRFGQFVTFVARGPWNDPSLRRGSKRLGSVLKDVDQTQPWVQLSCLYGESLMPPDAFEVFVRETARRKSFGLTALAIVLKDTEYPKTIVRQLSAGYEQADIEHQFFDEIEPALDWLASFPVVFDKNQVMQFFNDNTL
ncbi:hypothetical protein LJ739_14650 [Aestuariibacter halophilus]|uniref:Uncharacterized protein n=1 Tax=Fluctibacter halophilus TaxID=226011 RepID=A0ABS8GCE5_9ALTE|nr:hypothetical protein [Aestuariibacter halophilus]MCC2617490.1 hypothetical protein [Aestuariibacter halophilus]